MLGVIDKEAHLEAYSEGWAIEAQITIKKLKELLGDNIVDVQPIGSTSIVGIMAKPIIDIALGVKSLQQVKESMECLESNGFYFRPRTETASHILLACRNMERKVDTHYIHTVVWNNEEWKQYIRFRNILNSDEELRSGYEQLKIKLANEFKLDRMAYSEHKQAFIKQVLDLPDEIFDLFKHNR